MRDDHNGWVVHTIAIAQATVGDVKSALRTAACIRNPFAKSYALNGIAAAQALNGDVDGARQTIASLPMRMERLTGYEGTAIHLVHEPFVLDAAARR